MYVCILDVVCSGCQWKGKKLTSAYGQDLLWHGLVAWISLHVQVLHGCIYATLPPIFTWNPLEYNVLLFLVLTGCNVAMSINSFTYNTNAISDLIFSYLENNLHKVSTTRERNWYYLVGSFKLWSYCYYKYIILQAYMSLNAHSDYFVLTSWVHACACHNCLSLICVRGCHKCNTSCSALICALSYLDVLHAVSHLCQHNLRNMIAMD